MLLNTSRSSLACFWLSNLDLNPSKCNEKTSIDIKCNKMTPHNEQEYLKLQREIAGLE